MGYVPKPLDVSAIEIPNEILKEIEEISKNTHEVWAQGKIDNGWSWAYEYDEKNRKHPCLVPYEKLSELEKDYDRNTSIGVIKYMIAKGFTIKREA